MDSAPAPAPRQQPKREKFQAFGTTSTGDKSFDKKKHDFWDSALLSQSAAAQLPVTDAERESLLPAAGVGRQNSEAVAAMASQRVAAVNGGIDVEMDPGERRLNQLGYKQELKREMVRLMNRPLRIFYGSVNFISGSRLNPQIRVPSVEHNLSIRITSENPTNGVRISDDF